MLETRRG